VESSMSLVMRKIILAEKLSMEENSPQLTIEQTVLWQSNELYVDDEYRKQGWKMLMEKIENYFLNITLMILFLKF
jgi:hypothetical protein